MSNRRFRKAHQELRAAGDLAASQLEPDTATRKILASCAIDVCRLEAWQGLEEMLATTSAAAQDYIRDALEYVVEHPVIVDSTGEVFNARLFVIPVSQLLGSNIALQHLPQGELLRQWLTAALCPGGRGVLLNQLLSEEALAQLALKQVWDLAQALGTLVGPPTAEDGVSLYQRPQGEVVSGLHFVPFIAMMPVNQCTELLQLDGAELAMKSLSVMDLAHTAVTDHLVQDNQLALKVCLHLPQPFFYDRDLVALAHETYLFACALGNWCDAAETEGDVVRLRIRLTMSKVGSQVLVEAFIANQLAAEYAFEVEADDTETQSEICGAVCEMARPRGIAVTMGKNLALPVDSEDDDPRWGLLMDAPATLQ